VLSLNEFKYITMSDESSEGLTPILSDDEEPTGIKDGASTQISNADAIVASQTILKHIAEDNVDQVLLAQRKQQQRLAQRTTTDNATATKAQNSNASSTIGVSTNNKSKTIESNRRLSSFFNYESKNENKNVKDNDDGDGEESKINDNENNNDNNEEENNSNDTTTIIGKRQLDIAFESFALSDSERVSIPTTNAMLMQRSAKKKRRSLPFIASETSSSSISTTTTTTMMATNNIQPTSESIIQQSPESASASTLIATTFNPTTVPMLHARSSEHTSSTLPLGQSNDNDDVLVKNQKTNLLQLLQHNNNNVDQKSKIISIQLDKRKKEIAKKQLSLIFDNVSIMDVLNWKPKF
jgi:hypothetical protein